MSKEDTRLYKDLISAAKQYDYYASVTRGSNRDYWVNKAQETRAKAESVPDNYIDPPFVMPEWGTRGT